VISEKKSQLTQVLADLAETRQKLSQTTNQQKNKALSGSHDGSDTGSTSIQNAKTNEGSNENLGLTGVLNNNKWSITVLDESGKQSNSLNVSEQDRERESKLKQYYLEKYAQLESQLQMSDSKALDLFARKEKLEHILQQTKEERDTLQEQLRTLKTTALQSTDALESTKINYEQQLTCMSEHVIVLNENITRLREEIDQVKKFKVRCGKCKTWNTMEWLMSEGKNGRFCSQGNHPSSLNYA